MEPATGSAIASFIPLIIFSIPFAIGNFFLAPRLGASSIVYFILTIIPIVNWIFAAYVFYKVIFFLLDSRPKDNAEEKA